MKTINGLMKHLRDRHNIQIQGSHQKKILTNFGYYHCYKGYRFYKDSSDTIPYKTFNELTVVYNYDTQLKALLYEKIMYIETALKNMALITILEQAGSEEFSTIFDTILDNYKKYQKKEERDKAIRKKLELRDMIYKTITEMYSVKVINHFYFRDRNVPIWAIFEIISLGQFGSILLSMNQATRIKLSKLVGLASNLDPNGSILTDMVFAIKPLRNAIAHNNVLFDTRFKDSEISKKLSTYLYITLGIRVDFSNLTDYIILVAYLLKLIGYKQRSILTFLKEYLLICNMLKEEISEDPYKKVIRSEPKEKIDLLIKKLK